MDKIDYIAIADVVNPKWRNNLDFQLRVIGITEIAAAQAYFVSPDGIVDILEWCMQKCSTEIKDPPFYGEYVFEINDRFVGVRHVISDRSNTFGFIKDGDWTPLIKACQYILRAKEEE